LQRLRLLCSLLFPLLLGGCAQFSADGGMHKVAGLAGQPLVRILSEQDAIVAEEATRTLLASPLTADAAVKLALINNRSLQASLAEIGISEADLVRAGRLPNPFLAFSRISGAGLEIERTIGFDFLSLLTMPARIKIERQRFEQVQQQAALQAVQLAGNTRRAYFSAVAAAENERYMQQVEEAAAAAAELAMEMKKAGNWSALDALRQQSFYAEAMAQSRQAQHAQLAASEELRRLLGIGDNTALTMPQRLPDPPLVLEEIAQPAQRAMEQRLDVQIARSNTLALADALGLSRATALVDAVRLSYKNKSDSGAPRADGAEVSLLLPLFDWTGSKSKKAEALYLQSVHRSADVAVRAASDARTAYAARQTAHLLALHYRNTVVPLRKQISDETLLRYNGMLIGVFELLLDARSQMLAVNASIGALRDYWIAESNWQMALRGGVTLPGLAPALPIANLPAVH
jgi:outer membrane protein TolC